MSYRDTSQASYLSLGSRLVGSMPGVSAVQGFISAERRGVPVFLMWNLLRSVHRQLLDGAVLSKRSM